MRRRYMPSGWALAFVYALCLAILAIGSSCTKNERLTTIHASLLSVNVARDEFVTWDLEHQRDILKTATSREDALAKIAAYEEKRRKVEVGFELTYKALALAATQTDGPSLSAASSAVAELLDSIAKLRGGP